MLRCPLPTDSPTRAGSGASLAMPQRSLLLLAVVALGCAVAFATWRFARRNAADDRFAQNALLLEQQDFIQTLEHALVDGQIAALAGDDVAVARLAGAGLAWSGFPVDRGRPREVRPGVRELDWSWGAARVDGGDGFARELRRFLELFSEVEDLRLKLGHARVIEPGLRVAGELKLLLVGRDLDGRREWVRGKATLTARREGAEWRLETLDGSEVRSLVTERDLFVEVGLAAGFDHRARLFDDAQPPYDPAANNGAVAVSDVDGDGFLDVLVTGRRGNVLYWNRAGRFEPADDAGTAVVAATAAQVALFVDIDGDGDQDLFLSTWDKRQVLLEQRREREGAVVFVDVSERLGAYPVLLGNSLAAADVNGDARPDVFVGVWSEIEYTPLEGGHDPSDNGRPNMLFVSQPDGTYREAADAWGIRGARWSHAAEFADVNDDGRPDLYVANDYSGGNCLYVHERTHFVERATERGVLDRGWAMGVCFGDVDNDGDLDLHVTRMSSTAGARIRAALADRADVDLGTLALVGDGNKVYRNDGHGTFAEARFDSGEISAGWAFGGGLVDLDNDGWLDVYAPNGFRSGPSMRDT